MKLEIVKKQIHSEQKQFSFTSTARMGRSKTVKSSIQFKMQKPGATNTDTNFRKKEKKF